MFTNGLRTPRRASAGFTLAELLIFIVIFLFAIAGILLVINTTVAQSAEPMVRKQSIAVAESMMEEVSLMPIVVGGWAGPANQANRANFDNVQDYHGYNSGGSVYKVTDPAGGSTTGLNGFNVSVQVVATVLAGTPCLRITVTVTDPRGVSYVLEGYRL